MKFLAGFRIISGGLVVFRRNSPAFLEVREETALEITSGDPWGHEGVL